MGSLLIQQHDPPAPVLGPSTYTCKQNIHSPGHKPPSDLHSTNSIFYDDLKLTEYKIQSVKKYYD